MRISARRWQLWFLVLVLLCVLPFVPPFAGREDLLRWLVGAAVLAGLAIAFDFTAGYINIVNFGYAAFAGFGGYASALVAIHAGLPPWVTLLVVGPVAAGILGLATGLLTLRFRGIFATVVTWFLGLALMGLTRNLVDLTRGSQGLGVPLLIPGTSENLPYYFVAVAMMMATYLVLKSIVDSRMGLAFRAIGQNMEAARASGVNPTKYRIYNFVPSCAFAGWFGAFHAHYAGVLTPGVMDTARTIEILVVAYLGGRGSLWGGAVVAFPLIFATEWLRSELANYPGVHLIFYGALLIAVMLLYPSGLAGFVSGLRDRLSRSAAGARLASRFASSSRATTADRDADEGRRRELTR